LATDAEAIISEAAIVDDGRRDWSDELSRGELACVASHDAVQSSRRTTSSLEVLEPRLTRGFDTRGSRTAFESRGFEDG